MCRIRNPVIVAAVVAALAGTTGFCSYQGPGVAPVVAPPAVSPPVRLLPPATLPYPIEEPD